MTVWPLRFRQLNQTSLLFCDDAGGFFSADQSFLARYAEKRLSADDVKFLERHGHAFREDEDLGFTSFGHRWSLRQSRRPEMTYVVLGPALRCNIACAYCQVARADENAVGYEWSEETLAAVL